MRTTETSWSFEVLVLAEVVSWYLGSEQKKGADLRWNVPLLVANDIKQGFTWLGLIKNGENHLLGTPHHIMQLIIPNEDVYLLCATLHEI